ncbi:uncharacterized protein LOC126656483 isoform X2 [Mercurialis annua]|nr:uncharacterized protein LOC126656483 isoform X2 [Mercurialis annua]XP_050207020.1 uncharacterized protein LOC126656483 isoform X2 [Mercurialis annua]
MSGDLTGLSLDSILSDKQNQPQPPPSTPPPPAAASPAPPQMNRTLLDIIRDEEPNGSLFGQKDKKSWKAFRDRLRLKRAGAAWTSTVPIPASDIPINTNFANTNAFNQTRSSMSRRSSVRFTTISSVNAGDQSPRSDNDENNDHSPASASSIPRSGARPFMVRRVSSRYGTSPVPDENIHAVGDEPPARSFRPQMSRHNSSRNYDSPFIDGGEDEIARDGNGSSSGSRRLGVVLAEERQLSAREAVAAQEAAEAAAQAEADEEAEEGESPEAVEEEEEQPVRMSLMDLLEETDRQLGFVGSRYTVGDDEVECEEEEEEDDDDGTNGGDGIEHTCCVCMVRHKGAAFIPCGHTFCRLCSRELWVQRGNCPLCNGFIVEILDIF